MFVFRGRISLILLIIYIASVLFLSLYSFENTQVDLPKYFLGIPIDKIIHFIMYLPLPVLIWSVLVDFYPSLYNKSTALIISLFASIFISTSTEILQNTTEFRQFEYLDLIANYLGVIIGLLSISIIKKLIFYVRSSRLQ